MIYEVNVSRSLDGIGQANGLLAACSWFERETACTLVWPE